MFIDAILAAVAALWFLAAESFAFHGIFLSLSLPSHPIHLIKSQLDTKI